MKSFVWNFFSQRWTQNFGDEQGHQGFTPEYVIKNQTKPHLRNYSFLHSHFLTSSQTKLLIPWIFFNVQYIIRYSEDSRKAILRRRHRGFGSLHATALASKMRQQSDWTGKNYLFNIDCRWLGPVSVYLQTRISCFKRKSIKMSEGIKGTLRNIEVRHILLPNVFVFSEGETTKN